MCLFRCMLSWCSAVESVSTISSFSLALSEIDLLLLSVLLLVVFCAGWRKMLRGRRVQLGLKEERSVKVQSVLSCVIEAECGLRCGSLVSLQLLLQSVCQVRAKVCVNLCMYASLLASLGAKSLELKFQLKKQNSVCVNSYTQNNLLKCHLKPLRLIWAFRRPLTSN